MRLAAPAEHEADRETDRNDQAQFSPIRKWSEAGALGRNFDDANWNSRDVAASAATRSLAVILGTATATPTAEAIGNASHRDDGSVSY